MCVGECLLKAGEEAAGTGPGAGAATVPVERPARRPERPAVPAHRAAAAVGDWLRRGGPAPRPAGVGGGGASGEEARRLGVWAAGWANLARGRYGLLVPGPGLPDGE